ncbi:MAG: thioredoxin family protein [Pseudomonadota bacterium]
MSAKLLSLTVVCFILAITGCDDDALNSKLQKGALAPSLHTKTLADVGGDFGKITTYRQPDARMYQYSIDKALSLGRPIVLQFATPGHCSKCDEQLMMLKSLMEIYQPNVLFLHMDQYRNPEAFKAYQVMGDPWTFFIDNKGIVRRVQPGRMLYVEMESGIKEILKAEKEGRTG